jgi:predicted nucleic acid-binding protein
MTIVDTSVWIDFFRGNESTQVDRLAGMLEDDEGIGLTDVILTEILQGAHTERTAARLEARLSVFDLYRLEDLEDFRRAAAIYRAARRRGLTIRRTLDCLIASVCIRERVPILHSDDDFQRLASCTPLMVAP